MENNNFHFSLLYSVQSEKPSIKSLQQYLSRDFGLAWCHSSVLIPASFLPHQKKTPVFSSSKCSTARLPSRDICSVILHFWLMKQCWESMELPESCVALWVLSMFTARGLWIHYLRTAKKYFPAPPLRSSSPFFPINKVRFMYGAHCLCQRKGFIFWGACVVSGQHTMTYLVLVAQGFK